MAPLRREWEEVKCRCEENLWPAVVKAAQAQAGQKRRAAKPSPAREKFDRAIQNFVERLAHVSVLDPACGSGNFLYVALHLLLDLEKEVISYAASHGLSLVPHVHPRQLAGLEINPFAQQLASVVIWIGYLQWIHQNGFKTPSHPVLEPIDTIHCQDAILDLSDPKNPKEPEWPAAEFIVGNPPFLGGKLLRANLGDEYVDAMFELWHERVSREADLCCYWFEKARRRIEQGKCVRAGLLATQGIRGGANRKVLENIKQTGDIFFAESDRDWILEGANVHVSMVGFSRGTETCHVLDGKPVPRINANLTHAVNPSDAAPLRTNVNVAYMGVTKQGPFDIPGSIARKWLSSPNPSGKPNSNVLVPYLNGMDVTKRQRESWLIDFPHGIAEDNAAQFELPFEYVRRKVKPFRDSRARDWFRDQWWELYAPRPDMRRAMAQLKRFIGTPRVSKYRLFVWIDRVVLPDCQIIAFARDDDYFFGVLHSRVHEVWALRLGTRLETRPRYTPTTCFETFPLPEPTKKQEAAIAAAAKELDELRNRWLNPPEWTKTEVLEFPGSVGGPWGRYIDPATVQKKGSVPNGTVESEFELKQVVAVQVREKSCSIACEAVRAWTAIVDAAAGF